MDYKWITEEEFLELEQNWRKDHRSIPKGYFVARLSNGNYLAMDNSTGECWTEEFTSKVLIEEFFNDGLGYGSNYSNTEIIRHRNTYY